MIIIVDNEVILVGDNFTVHKGDLERIDNKVYPGIKVEMDNSREGIAYYSSVIHRDSEFEYLKNAIILNKTFYLNSSPTEEIKH